MTELELFLYFNLLLFFCIIFMTICIMCEEEDQK